MYAIKRGRDVSIGRRFAWPNETKPNKKHLDKTCTYTLHLITERVRTRYHFFGGFPLSVEPATPYLLPEDVIYETDISLSSHLHGSGCRFLDLRERTSQ